MTTVDTRKATSISAVKPLVEEFGDRFTRLSDEIWDHPELRWEEHRSMAKQIEAAEEFGGRITREAGGVPTAFSAEWGSGSPVIGFLGEYDALASLSQAAGSTIREPDPGNTTSAGHGLRPQPARVRIAAGRGRGRPPPRRPPGSRAPCATTAVPPKKERPARRSWSPAEPSRTWMPP
ncbi:hypothetical protein [Microbacterium elymi]|uniref:Amidohydrolase n=1 Tax=Microbacterium elymi TaxID=2909587 RepID=A0ABY5NK45_9MICO|nr:hypothetical protein [Microbacterium elymi]UUT35542.1 hypothetical protein L2X98_19565 [Microbacterium elymi]